MINIDEVVNAVEDFIRARTAFTIHREEQVRLDEERQHLNNRLTEAEAKINAVLQVLVDSAIVNTKRKDDTAVLLAEAKRKKKVKRR